MPAPAHPRQRREPLPGHAPKSPIDDPTAAAAVRGILASRAYREADQDIDFLQESETRGLRLQLEYLKAETVLRAHNVGHTVVVFGGTRIHEPQAAARRLQEAAAALSADPVDANLRRRHAIAERLQAKCKYYEIARELGRLVGCSGESAEGGRILIMTGGGPGIMEAANRGASDVGAKSIGLDVALPHQPFPNPYVSPELCLKFRYSALRKLHFALRARALVAFPGGFGTMDELFEILELSQTRKMPPVPVILVGESYWRKAFDPEFLVEEGMIDPEDRELFWFAESAHEVWHGILAWYKMKGAPLCRKTVGAP
jgi:uncharacterized protein (TIGR00730 family)